MGNQTMPPLGRTYADEECLDNGKPDALKVKPTIMMMPGYYSLKDRAGTLFQTYKGGN